MLDPKKAELLRAQLPDSRSAQLPIAPDSSASLADPLMPADAPCPTAVGPQPQDDSSGATPALSAKSDLPEQATAHAAGPKRGSQTAIPSDLAVLTHGKKRKADKPCASTAAGTEADALLAGQEEDVSGHEASMSHAKDKSNQPKQARVRVGCSKRPRPGTLQAAFAKAKVLSLACYSTVANNA